MPRKISTVQPITVPQVKVTLEKLGAGQLDQFQQRSLDYATKFSKVNPQMAENMVRILMERFELDERESVQIVNCMPKSIEEIRIFLAGGRKIVETSKLEVILSVLNEHRKER